jgi:hypothetical protein
LSTLAELASDPDDDFEFSQKMAHHLQGPNGREGGTLLQPCIEDTGKKIQVGDWLRDGIRASEDGSDSASSPLAKKAAVQGTWVTLKSTLEVASFVSPI